MCYFRCADPKIDVKHGELQCVTGVFVCWCCALLIIFVLMFVAIALDGGFEYVCFRLWTSSNTGSIRRFRLYNVCCLNVGSRIFVIYSYM